MVKRAEGSETSLAGLTMERPLDPRELDGLNGGAGREVDAQSSTGLSLQ